MTATVASTLVDALGQQHVRAADTARIVSLVPSITELVCELDLAGQLVGRTGFCIHPRDVVRGIGKVGGTKDVDVGAVVALRPTHVIVNIDENTRETFEALRAHVPHVIVTHPNAPEDNLALYRLLGGIFGREALAERWCARLEAALGRVRAHAGERPPRQVLYLIWRKPWMTVTPDTYVSAMLREVGWHTVPAVSAQRYPALDDTALQALAPDLCLLSSEPYPFRERHLREVEALVGMQVPVRLVDGEMISWYGSRAVAGLDYLARFAAEALAPAA